MVNYGTGKAGQWAKDHAHRAQRRLVGWVVVICFGSGLLLGAGLVVPLQPILHRHVNAMPHLSDATCWTMYFGFTVACLAAIRWLPGRFDEPLDRLALDRIKMMRGGQAEALVVMTLRHLDDRWHLFNNVTMAGGGDVDHVLVGPGGLYCVSTKSHRGLYAWDAGRQAMTLNGQPTDHGREAQRMALQLRHWLEARIRPEHGVTTVPYVVPVLCLPIAAVDVPAGATNVRVLTDDALHDLAADAKPTLRPAQVRGCVAVLKDMTGTAARPAPVAVAT